MRSLHVFFDRRSGGRSGDISSESELKAVTSDLTEVTSGVAEETSRWLTAMTMGRMSAWYVTRRCDLSSAQG